MKRSRKIPGARVSAILAVVLLVTLPVQARAQDSTSSGTAHKSASKVPAKSSSTTARKSSSSKSHTASSKSQTAHKSASTAQGSKAKKSSGVRSTGSAKAGTSAHAGATKGKRTSSRGRKSARVKGQQKIDSERAQTIQAALIREHYLSGDPTGKWNDASEEAMRRYQADHGWQTKTVPDARALISLGLGPSKDHLLNPESAMTTEPSAPRTTALDPVSHSADPEAAPGKLPSSDPPVPTSTGKAEDSAHRQ